MSELLWWGSVIVTGVLLSFVTRAIYRWFLRVMDGIQEDW